MPSERRMAPVLEIAFYLLLAYAASMTLPLVFNSTSTGLDPSWSFRINPAVRFAVHSQKHARIGSRIAPAKLSGCTSNPMIRSSLLLLIFLASFLLGMLLLFLLDGRHAAGLPTNTSNADVRVCTASKTDAPPRGFIPSGLTQPSIGELPHWIARVPAGIALPLFGSVLCRSHRQTVGSSGLASRPAQLHTRLKPIPSANR